MVFQIEKIIAKFKNFENHQISILDRLKQKNQSYEIVEFQKLANFFNLTICKTIKIEKFRIWW